jgi:hypothetical protein
MDKVVKLDRLSKKRAGSARPVQHPQREAAEDAIEPGRSLGGYHTSFTDWRPSSREDYHHTFR